MFIGQNRPFPGDIGLYLPCHLNQTKQVETSNRCLKVMSSLKIYRPAKSLAVEVNKDYIFKGEAENWINTKDLKEGALLYGAGTSVQPRTQQ